MLLGASLLLLAGAGGGAAARRVNWVNVFSVRGFFPQFQPRPNDPRLAPGAVFAASGIVCLALGAVL